MSPAPLTPFFAPRGVLLVGASHDPTKLGYGLARNLVQSNYQGAVHFVNPKGGNLLGRPLHTRIADTPDPVDLAILLIPATSVPVALGECGERGIHAAIIGAGGFRETGPDGAVLETECLHVARAFDMRLMGPNCVGLLDTHLPLDATFLPPPGPPPGDVAFISHSGAICAAVIDWARGQGFGLSRLVSLGNQADVNETDVLAPVAADPFTRVLTLYLEGVSDGRRFIIEASRVARQKPLIALKVGRFSSGQRAVASHTGALAGQEAAYDAAFRKAGVIRAETSEEMFDWARALAWCPPPQGRAVAVLTNAGGPGVTAADALEAGGQHLAELSNATHLALQAILPAAASLHNPVDMLASASPEQFAACLKLLLADAGVDSALVIMPPPPMYTAGAVAKALIPVIHNAEKPVVVALMGERLIQEAVEHFRAARVPEYRFPERAASALAVLTQRAEYLAAAGQGDLVAGRPDNLHPEEARIVLEQFLQPAVLASPAEPSHAQPAVIAPAVQKSQAQPTVIASPVQPSQAEPAVIASAAKRSRLPQSRLPQSLLQLPQETILRLLAAYGIATLPIRLAHTAEEAARIASELGFPAAVKVASPDIPHKSDAGGVLLDLPDAEAVRCGFETVVQNARLARPQAEILGAHVQRMLPEGQDVIAGAVQDAQFGPLVMFGSGGVEVEGLKDVAFGLAPLSRAEAEYLLEHTWAGRKLRGYRSLPPADREAVLEALLRLAQLAADFPELTEIEINPLRVLEEGKGAVAVDVRAHLG